MAHYRTVQKQGSTLVREAPPARIDPGVLAACNAAMDARHLLDLWMASLVAAGCGVLEGVTLTSAVRLQSLRNEVSAAAWQVERAVSSRESTAGATWWEGGRALQAAEGRGQAAVLQLGEAQRSSLTHVALPCTRPRCGHLCGMQLRRGPSSEPPPPRLACTSAAHPAGDALPRSPPSHPTTLPLGRCRPRG